MLRVGFELLFPGGVVRLGCGIILFLLAQIPQSLAVSLDGKLAGHRGLSLFRVLSRDMFRQKRRLWVHVEPGHNSRPGKAWR